MTENTDLVQPDIDKKYLFALALLTFSGIILRLYNISTNSLWLDESNTFWFSVNPIEYLKLISTFGEVHPPLFYWFEYIPLLISHSEFALRIIPAIFGVLSIPAIYYLGKEVVDQQTGIIAALFVTISPYLIYYSQEARMYSMILFFSIIMLFYFVRALDGNRINFMLFTIFAVVLSWTHFFAFIFAIVVMITFYSINRAHDYYYDKPIFQYYDTIPSFCVFFFGTLPVMYIGIGAFIIKSSIGGINWGTIGVPIVSITFTALSTTLQLAMIFIPAFVIGMWFVYRKNVEVMVLFSIVLAFTVFGAVLLSYFTPIMPRYLIFVTPVFYIGVAASAKWLDYWVQPWIYSKYILVILLIVFIGISGVQLQEYYSQPTKDQWKDAAEYLELQACQEDQIVLIPGYNYVPFLLYYHGKSEIIGVSTINDLSKIVPDSEVYFVITGDIKAIDFDKYIKTWLSSNTNTTRNFHGIEIRKL